MSITVSAKGGKDFPLHPPGPVAARCTRIIDLGTQAGEYQGKPKVARKLLFVWESATLMGDDQGEYAGKPFLITTRYTASLSDKAALRKALESWRGRKFTAQELEAFDLKGVLGKPCMLNMVHSDDGKYSNISSIMPLPSGMTAPKPVGELIMFSLDDFSRDVFEKLSDGLKEQIAKSPEYQAIASGKPAPGKTQSDNMDDDIPF